MDTEILVDLKGENNKAFGELYKVYFPIVCRFILRNKGNETDAEDIFQDTMLVLLEKLRMDNFQLTASLKTYIIAISKNLWFKKLRSPYREIEYSDFLYDSNFIEEIDLSIEKEKSYWDKLQNYIHRISSHCQGLIHDIFFKEKAIEEIQKTYGYATKHSAQNQKHKCVEQIRKVKSTEEKNLNNAKI